MSAADQPTGEDGLTYEITKNHLVHFTSSDPRCRGMQLPEGVLLRYTLSSALYFYLRTGVRDGKIWTRIYASDSPYDRQKAKVGDVLTPIFDPRADVTHLKKVHERVLAWVDFVRESADDEVVFRNFPVEDSHAE